MEAYTGLINRNLAEESLLSVAINNLVALKGPKDISDSLRKLDWLIEKGNGAQRFQLSNGLEFKLSPKQRETMYTNRVLLLLHSNKMDQWRLAAQELLAGLPDMFADSVMPVLLQATVWLERIRVKRLENKSEKAEEILGQFAGNVPDKTKVVLLASAQLVVAAAGHPQIAAETLSKMAGIQHLHATVATIVSLKELAGDIDGADYRSCFRFCNSMVVKCHDRRQEAHCSNARGCFL